MFFRSLSLFAAVACATFALASPVLTSPNPSGLTGALSGLTPPASAGSLTAALPIFNAVALSDPTTKVRRNVDQPSLPEVFDTCHKKISPLAEQLNAAIIVVADIKVDVIVGLLNEIIVILGEAAIQVQYIVDNPEGFALTLGVVVLTVEQVALILSTLLYLLFGVIAAVVASIDVSTGLIVLPLVANIGGIVVSILGHAFILVPALQAAVVILLNDLVKILISLKLVVVVNVLGIVY